MLMLKSVQKSDKSKINYSLSVFHPTKLIATATIVKLSPDIEHLAALRDAIDKLMAKLVSLGQALPTEDTHSVLVEEIK